MFISQNHKIFTSLKDSRTQSNQEGEEFEINNEILTGAADSKGKTTLQIMEFINHPLMLAYNSQDNVSVELLLNSESIINDLELMSYFYTNAILNEVTIERLRLYLAKIDFSSCRELINSLLLPALMMKNKEIINLLLHVGASPNEKIVRGKTALDIAHEYLDKDIIKLLNDSIS